MADIQLRCAQCGKEITVSEFASAEALTCPACGQALALPERSKPAPLTIRPMSRESKTALTGGEMDLDVLARAVAGKETESVLGEVHKARTAVKKSTTIWLFIALLIVGGGLVGWQYALAEDIGPGALSQWYATVRSAVAGLGALLVLLVAFYESPWQGLFCLLLPFYILYYAVVRMEYNLVRGIFLGVCVALVAEVRLVPDRSLLLAAQGGFNGFVATANKQIQRAGEPPGMPPKRRRGRHAKPKSCVPRPAIPSWPASLRR
jgi:DNA-directed RNA polymerase subunit RPC12/RpoP